MGATIMQGDQYALLFTGTEDGRPLDMEQIERIEFCVGQTLCKYWPEEVTQDSEGNFLFPLSQQETLGISEEAQHVQIRVKFKGAGTPTVIGVDAGEIQVKNSISKVVL